MLIANNLSLIRSGRSLFKNLNLSVKSKSIVQIRGRNGIGKTTLIKILARIILPSTGEIFWEGKNIKNNINNYYKNLALVMDTNTSKNDISSKTLSTEYSTNFPVKFLFDCRHTFNKIFIICNS